LNIPASTPATRTRSVRQWTQWSILIAAAVSLAACGADHAKRAEEAPRPVYVANVRSADQSALAFVGDVRAVRRAELSFAVSGMVTDVRVEPGDAVRKGQILASLDDQPLRAQLAAATADAQRAQASVAEARENVERMRSAQQASAASAAEWGAVQLELASASAALNSAQAQRDHAVWQLERALLRSPIDGVVAERLLEPGQAAGPGASVLSIDGVGRELVIQVPGNLTLHAGEAVTLRGAEGAVQSRVLRTAGRMEAGGVRRVWLAVPEEASPGSTWSAAVRATSGETTPDIVQVPLRAVTPGATADVGSALRLASDGQTLERVVIKLGAVQDDWVDVHAGLSSTDRVVVAGARVLQPGMKVTPVVAKR
jgi:RND family efflux transporter MFP subunit